MRNILFVEDAPEFHLVVENALKDSNLHLISVTNANDAEKALHANHFDLILLDVRLPDANGFDLCRKWRADPKLGDVPVICITGQNELSDKLMGFSLGADDYVVKPFEPLELRARIESRIRKAHVPEVFQKEDLYIKAPFQKAYIMDNGKEHDLGLTPVEFKLLYHLISNESRNVTTNELLKTVWGENVHVVGQSVYTHISALRRKLGPTRCSIESAATGGYRFRSSSEHNAR